MVLSNTVMMVFCGVVATVIGDLVTMGMGFIGLGKSKWGLVGRWIAGLPAGKWINPQLSTTPAVRGEVALGWGFHYFIGIIYGVLYIGYCLWFSVSPAFSNAITFGILTVLAPYLILKPGMGGGIFARKSPNPLKSCLLSLVVHTAFGFGLWIGVKLFVLLNA